MKLDKFQEDFLNCPGDKILCTGRQVGKSLVCSLDAGRFVILNSNVTVLIVAPTERQSFALFEKVLNYLETHARKLILRKKDKPTKSLIKLSNGSKIYCLPVGISGANIRGLTVHRVYFEEGARIPEDAFAAISPMLLTTGGSTIYLSTPYGKKGEFWRCLSNEDHAYDSFTRFSVNSMEVMKNREISETWTETIRDKAVQRIEQAKSRMSAREFMQEYEGEFCDDLLQCFPDDQIKKVMNTKRQGNQRTGRFYLGVDIARMGKDDSAFQIVEMLSRKRFIHIESMITNKKKLNETYNKIIELDRMYKFKKIFMLDHVL